MRLFFLLSFLVLLTPNFSSAAINRNLKIGDLGEDVRELQVFLNKDPETLVSASGPGSKGQETTYFGAKTEAAVNKFQLKYKDKLLKPIGLYSPTGIVGPMMRGVINQESPVFTTSNVERSAAAESQSGLNIAQAQVVTSKLININFGDISEAEFTKIADSFSSSVSGGSVLAASSIGGYPFGGRISFTVPCSNGVLLVVGPPKPGIFMFVPVSSQLFLEQQLRVGPWSLGISDGTPTVCVLPNAANPPAPNGTIWLIGTSF